ncbi:MAG: GntR family transcriptional regulator [Firmicutes bacterium]|nr:GntR family transcriptional regulator [Bacillota bacterium]
MTQRKSDEMSIRSRLLKEMRQGIFASSLRLPPENELCALLGVSRTQLRDSLAQLDREGFISRCHGVGTLINRHVLAIQTRMDLEVEFMDMVREAGFVPEAKCLGAETRGAGPEVAERLHVAEGAPCLHIAKLVTADGRGAILCQDIIDCAKIRDHCYPEDVFVQPVFYFLQRFCGLTPLMDVTSVRAVAAAQEVAEALGVEPGSPLLYMDEVDYDRDGAPILYARQFYADGIVRHSLIRKKI